MGEEVGDVEREVAGLVEEQVVKQCSVQQQENGFLKKQVGS